MRRWTRLVGAVAVLVCGAVLLGGCSSSSGGSSGSTAGGSSTGGASTANMIVIKNFMFSPSNLTVAPGATVTVKNEDTATHTLTATGAKAFDTGDITGGSTKTFTAPTKPGSYGYLCGIHQYMTATLTVK